MAQSASESSQELKRIPGGYGLPLFGAIKDRLDFFWFQGEEEFFRSRMIKHKSSIFRTNFVPGPPGYPNPRGISLLDHKSYTVLLDKSKVDKVDCFVGPFVPALDFTGGYHVLSYLDPSDESHTRLKGYAMELLRSNSGRVIPEFDSAFDATFRSLEQKLAAKKGNVDVVNPLEDMIITFLLKLFAHRDPTEPGPANLGSKSLLLFKSWILVQYSGVAKTPLPHLLEELLLHSFRLPFFLIARNYNKICKFIRTHAIEALDLAQNQFGISQEEAVHNLVFLIGLNAWFGLSRLLPATMYHLGSNTGSSELLHARLRREIRDAVRDAGGSVTLDAIDKMPLVKATALEVLRVSPPAPFQYARARTDFVLEGRDGMFQVKAGELLGGNQNFVNKDPSVFPDGESFLPDRFIVEGQLNVAMARQVLWSNGWGTDYPTAQDKQCAGKDLVELMSRLFIVEFFLRYDTFELESGAQLHKGTNAAISLKSLKKANQLVSS